MERKHCECGRFAVGGRTKCWACLETEGLERKLKECREKVKEYAGPDGRRWRVNISAQNQTFKNHSSARAFAEALLALEVWYMDLEEVA